MLQCQSETSAREEVIPGPTTSRGLKIVFIFRKYYRIVMYLKILCTFLAASLQCMEEFLKNSEFAQYFELFEAEEISLDVLAEMTHAELKELGIKAYGHRHRLLRAARRHLSGPQRSMIQGYFNLKSRTGRWSAVSKLYILIFNFIFTPFLIKIFLQTLVFPTYFLSKNTSGLNSNLIYYFRLHSNRQFN